MLQYQVIMEAFMEQSLKPREDGRRGAVPAVQAVSDSGLSEVRNRYPARTFDGVFDTEKY